MVHESAQYEVELPLRIGTIGPHREIRFADVYHLTPQELEDMRSVLNVTAFFQGIANLPRYESGERTKENE